MAKQRILLIGSNGSVINEFFRNMDDLFEFQTSSMRYDDILSHIKYFDPMCIICCLANENYDDFQRMVSVKQKMDNRRIAFLIIGDSAICEEFNKTAFNVSNLTIVKPFTTTLLRTKVQVFLKNWEQKYKKAREHYQEHSANDTSNTSSLDVSIADVDLNTEVADILNELDNMTSKNDEAKKARTNQKKIILIIDDDPLMQRSIKASLGQDYTVAAAISGNVAFRFLENRPADLILLDYEMPGEKGPDVLEKLQKNPATKDIPVVFLTGAADHEKILKALSLKPQGYMLKPIKQKDLLKKVEELIG